MCRVLILGVSMVVQPCTEMMFPMGFESGRENFLQ